MTEPIARPARYDRVQDLWDRYVAARLRYESAPTPRNYVDAYAAWEAWSAVYLAEGSCRAH